MIDADPAGSDRKILKFTFHMKYVYYLADLESRDRLDEGAGLPARLAVIGHPVAHSASPPMHQAALDALQIAARYIRIDIEPGQVAAAVARMRALGFIGCNVTVPHKLEAMAVCDRIDPAARQLGAVNTLSFESDRVLGSNTDAPGFRRAVEEAFASPLAGMHVLIAGAGGGAGQAVAAACLLAGVSRLTLANRSRGKLDGLLDRLRQVRPSGVDIEAFALDDPPLGAAAAGCDLIVNTSSLGLKEGDTSILPAGFFLSGARVFDTIYQPAVTPLMRLASAAGCPTANGLGMLLHQGALAFQTWFPGTDPLATMREALAAVTRQGGAAPSLPPSPSP